MPAGFQVLQVLKQLNMEDLLKDYLYIFYDIKSFIKRYGIKALSKPISFPSDVIFFGGCHVDFLSVKMSTA